MGPRKIRREEGGETRNRTEDTRIFSPLLYQLSYLATEDRSSIIRGGSFESTLFLGKVQARVPAFRPCLATFPLAFTDRPRHDRGHEKTT